MTNVQVISEQQVFHHKFKIYGDFENPLFLAKDVAAWIDHNNITNMMNIVDEDEKLTYTIRNSGQNREMWFLTEDGLYEVLMQSRKPIAKTFKKEVKNILKEIRKHGGFIVSRPEDDDEIIMARALLIANRAIERKQRENEALHKQIEADAPYTSFGKTIAVSDAAVNVGVFAK